MNFSDMINGRLIGFGKSCIKDDMLLVIDLGDIDKPYAKNTWTKNFNSPTGTINGGRSLRIIEVAKTIPLFSFIFVQESGDKF